MKGLEIVKATARSFLNKASVGMRRHAPTAFIIVGAAGVVTGFVLAIKAGKDSSEKTQQAREDLEFVHSKKELAYSEPDENVAEEDTYTKMDYAKDLTHAYLNLILAYIRVYGPAALTTTLSLVLILKSHKMLKKENAITYASLVATTKAYDSYRRNVIEAEGKEADERYRFGIKAIERERELLDKNGNPKLDKDGNPKKIKEIINVLNDETVTDIRSVLWDEITAAGTFDNYSCLGEYERRMRNVHTVLQTEESANNMLHRRAEDPRNNGIGYVWLNEVLLSLGCKPWDIGQVVGWKYDPRLDPKSKKFDPCYEAPDGWGDNCVDFGINNPNLPGYEQGQAFITGKEDAVLLYLNYDGLIYHEVGLKTTPPYYSKGAKK